MSFRSFIVSLQIVCVMALMLATAGRASAHAEIVRSEPTAGATVATAPQQVTIEFSQLLDAAKSSITVLDAAGATVSQGKAEVMANNNKAMRVALKPNLAPGAYRVEWSAVSAEDGDAESHSFTFTVGGATGTGAAPSTSANQGGTPAAQLPATGATTGTTYYGLLTVLGLALIGLGLAMRNGRRAGLER